MSLHYKIISLGLPSKQFSPAHLATHQQKENCHGSKLKDKLLALNEKKFVCLMNTAETALASDDPKGGRENVKYFGSVVIFFFLPFLERCLLC